MGILSNFIGGAAEAGGNILQRQRESDADLQKQQQYAKYNDDLARARELTTMELRKQYEQERDQYLSSPEYIARQTAAGRAKAEGEIATNLALAPKVAEVEAAKFEAGKGTREAAQKEALRFSLDAFREKSAAEVEADIKKLNNKEYQRGVAAEAAAKRDPGAAALNRVQLEVAQLALKEKQADAKIPPAAKLLAEPIKKEMDVIVAAIAKARSENLFDPTSENGKSLLAQHADATRRLTNLITPYLDGGKTTKPAEPEADPIKAAMDAARLKKDGAQPKPKPGAAAEPSAPAEPTPARNQGARNPYVDSKGRPLPNAPSDGGQTAWESTVKPGIVGAAAAVNQAGSNTMKTYLQEKIARNEALSPSEQVRAKQFGLVK